MKNKIITFLSAKGGIGKSQIVANFGKILSEAGHNTAILEVPNFNNQEIILNAKFDKNRLVIFAQNSAKALKISQNLTLISLNDEVFIGDDSSLDDFVKNVKESDMFDFVLIDASNAYAKTLISASDERIVVCANEPCAISNTYAFLKSLNSVKKEILFFMNFVRDEAEAIAIFENLKSVAQKNLGQSDMRLIGFMPYDKYVALNARVKRLFSEARPYCKASCALNESVSRTLAKLQIAPLDLKNLSGIGGFLRKLSNLV